MHLNNVRVIELWARRPEKKQLSSLAWHELQVQRLTSLLLAWATGTIGEAKEEPNQHCGLLDYLPHFFPLMSLPIPFSHQPTLPLALK